jgi:hypothetical protein
METLEDRTALSSPSVSFPVPAGEGSASVGTVRIAVELSAPSDTSVTVHYAVTAATASAGKDYILPDGVVSFAPRQTSRDISLSVRNHNLVEPDKRIQVTLFNASNATLGENNVYTYTIHNNTAYTATGPYLNCSDDPPIEQQPDVRMDAQGVPLKHSGSAWVYDPITISQYGLQQYSDFVATGIQQRLTNALRVADWLVQKQDAGSGEWSVHSAPAQGLAMSLLTRAYARTTKQAYLDTAVRALLPFESGVAEGGVVADLFGNPFYEQSPSKPSYNLNGFLTALLGLYDLSQEAPDSEAGARWDAGLSGAIFALPFYNAETMSFSDLQHVFDRPHAPNQSWAEHRDHALLLEAINTISPNDVITFYAAQWGDYLPPNPTYPTPLSDLPTVSFVASAGEGSAATPQVTIALSLSAPSDKPVTVEYTAGGGDAIFGTHYDLADGRVTFAPRETSRSITLSITDTHRVEADLTVQVVLRNPSNAALGKNAVYIYTILNKNGYTPTGSYLNYGELSSFVEQDNKRLDSKGIPMVDYYMDGHWLYWPSIISEHGLQEYSYYVEGGGPAHLANAIAMADWLLQNQDPETGSWFYQFDFAGRVAPWGSAMAQGYSISLLTRVYKQTGNRAYLDAAVRALQPLEVDASQGGDVDSLFGHPMYQEYPGQPSGQKSEFTLNGFIFTLLGLYDLAQQAPESDAPTLYDTGRQTLLFALPMFDKGGVSCYDLYQIVDAPRWTSIDLYYNTLHVQLLQAVNSISPDPLLRYYCAAWRNYVPANPAPVIAGIDPLAPGQTTLTITGSNFLSTSGVLWNGHPLQTTYLSDTQLQAVVPADYLSHSGLATITVANPRPGGGQSMPQVITIPDLPAAPARAGGLGLPSTLRGGGGVVPNALTEMLDFCIFADSSSSCPVGESSTTRRSPSVRYQGSPCFPARPGNDMLNLAPLRTQEALSAGWMPGSSFYRGGTDPD